MARQLGARPARCFLINLGYAHDLLCPLTSGLRIGVLSNFGRRHLGATAYTLPIPTGRLDAATSEGHDCHTDDDGEQGVKESVYDFRRDL